MRWAGTSRVVMASTRVDLPEPMSPVNKPLRPPSSRVQTRLSKVPQLKTSSRIRRKPDSESLALKSRASKPAPSSRPERCCSIIRRPRLRFAQLRLVGGQPQIKIDQPLRIDKGFEDAAHLVHRLLRRPPHVARLGLQASYKAEVNDLVQMRFHLVHEA